MSKSKIDWCDETINIFTGCRHGCAFCYARKMANRLASMPGNPKYRRIKRLTGNPFIPSFHLDVFGKELERLDRMKKPRRVFVGSMGDICFEDTALCFNGWHLEPCGNIDSRMVQGEIADFCKNLPQHTFQILTKRPDLLSVDVRWPSNVHLGVSLSRDEDAHRIATLLDKKAVGTGSQGGGRWHPQMVLWASVEPLLDREFDPRCLRGLDWVVIGAKTGGRRGVASSIIQSAKWIVHICARFGIPCFVKDNMRQADPDYDWPREFPK